MSKSMRFSTLFLANPIMVGLTVTYPQYFTWLPWSVTVFSLIVLLVASIASQYIPVKKTIDEHYPKWKIYISRFLTGASIGVLYAHEYFYLATLMLITMIYGIGFVYYMKNHIKG